MAPLLAPAQAEPSGTAAQTCERLLTELSESNRAIFHKHPSLRDKVPICQSHPGHWSHAMSPALQDAYCATCARPRCTDDTCGLICCRCTRSRWWRLQRSRACSQMWHCGARSRWAAADLLVCATVYVFTQCVAWRHSSIK